MGSSGFTARAAILPEAPLPRLRIAWSQAAPHYLKLQLFQRLLAITDTTVFSAVLPLRHD
jgi:hypothetical protein